MQIKADIADAAGAPTQVSLPSGKADGPPVRDRRGSQSDRRGTARVVLWEPKKRRRSRAIRGLNKLIKGKLQVAVLIVLLLVGAGVAALVQSGDEGMTDKRWRTSQYYYDLETGKLFVLPARQLMVPPFKREESGNTAVKAYVYACGKCDKKNSFIGYIEMYTARAKKATIDNDELALKSLAVEGKTMLIGDPRSRQWYPDHSGPAKRLRDVAKRHGCSGAALLRCDP